MIGDLIASLLADAALERSAKRWRWARMLMAAGALLTVALVLFFAWITLNRS